MSNIINITNTDKVTITLEQAKSAVLMYKGETFTFFDEGCTRYVYANKDNTKVIKILKNDVGLNYNQQEIDIYAKASEETKSQMVRTELVGGIIEQDFVTPIKFGGKKLTIPQRLFANSCRGEVGWTIDGNLVCFDLDEFKKY